MRQLSIAAPGIANKCQSQRYHKVIRAQNQPGSSSAALSWSLTCKPHAVSPLARFTTKQLDTFHPEDHLSPRRHFSCHIRAGCGQRKNTHKKKDERLCSRLSYFLLMISREKYVRAATKTEFSPTFEGQPSVPGKSCKNNILIFIRRGLTAIPSWHVLPEVIYIFSIYLQFITYNCNPFPVHRLALK